jgi:hypothetical protein
MKKFICYFSQVLLACLIYFITLDIKCDVQQKKVVVTGTASVEEMLNAIKKTGKSASVVTK